MNDLDLRPLRSSECLDKDEISEHIKLAEILYAEDGRVFEITSWCPRVVVDEVIRVDMKALIRLRVENPE